MAQTNPLNISKGPNNTQTHRRSTSVHI